MSRITVTMDRRIFEDRFDRSEGRPYTPPEDPRTPRPGGRIMQRWRAEGGGVSPSYAKSRHTAERIHRAVVVALDRHMAAE